MVDNAYYAVVDTAFKQIFFGKSPKVNGSEMGEVIRKQLPFHKNIKKIGIHFFVYVKLGRLSGRHVQSFCEHKMKIGAGSLKGYYVINIDLN